MNTQQLPSVELIQGASPPEPRGPARWRRWKVFFTVLLVSAAIGLAIVYGRSPVYRAGASVLTVKPKAVDTRSAEADIEHVAIQGRLLLGDELLGRLSQRLGEDGDEAVAGTDRLRGILSVVPVPETNLLELRAEGSEPAQLQRVVNRWAESYEVFRAEEIEAATGRTTAELLDQQAQLEAKIEAARAELQAFREANDIVSLERGENRSLAQLRGLNDSLNKARDRLVEVRAKKVAVDEAIARGETVIPSEHKAEISKLQRELERGRIRLADLRQRYTQAYMDRDPMLKALPEEVRALEQELTHALRLSSNTVSEEAQQEVEAARLAVATLETQLSEHQREVQQFTERFKEFEALEENLARLNELHAGNAERLAQIEVRNFKEYPPIQVVEWAREPTRPIYPDYERDLMIALGISLGLALFATWLVEYLSERSSTSQTGPYLGVRVYAGGQPQALDAAQGNNRLTQDSPDAAAPAEAPPRRLPALPRELSGIEVGALMQAVETPADGYAALLLSGVSPYELPLLHAACFDESSGQLEVPGSHPRRFTLSAKTWQHLRDVRSDMDGERLGLPVAELDGRLRQAARDARLTDPQAIDALALWHTYVLHLVRQGIDPADLAGRVGPIPPAVQEALMQHAPPGDSRPLERIDFTYPVLA